MRIHLGHHFYGAGNLGDDFMLAGFLAAMRTLAPDASFSCCVPFALDPLRARFPEIIWLPCDDRTRQRCIAECAVWLGLGGSPFQSEQSRWFVDHLVGEAASCRQAQKPMFFLGVGVQTTTELAVPDIQRICAGAAGIWTRDVGSAQRLQALPSPPPITVGADLAHLFFHDHLPPPAAPKRVTLVANFDYGAWPGQTACLSALNRIEATEFVWLAQESRDLPGAEHALYATLPGPIKSQWRFVSPEIPGAPLSRVLNNWPTGAWLVTARYHAALAGSWAGSRIVVLSTNQKLRAAATELGAPLLSPDADASAVSAALDAARVAPAPHALAEVAHRACAEFLRSAVAHRR